MSHLSPSASVLDHFSALSDPRQRWRVLYPLPEILLLVLCATLSGMEDFVEIRLWGGQRLDFLRRFLPYERGLPAHDTLNDVINGLDAELFKTCFANWVEALRERVPDIIAIDGKTSRRTHARRKGRGPLHLVSAWAARQRLVLGQEAVDDKSNEIVRSCSSGWNSRGRSSPSTPWGPKPTSRKRSSDVAAITCWRSRPIGRFSTRMW
jgi:hypothetical protein